MIAERLRELGIVLPAPFPPGGNYASCVVDDGMVYVSGHGPIDGDTMIRGKVGGDLSVEQGREAARMTGLSILATMQAELGDLDRIARIVRVLGMVFGEAGRHARSAVGLAELPFGIAVEVELTARLHP